MNTIVCTSINPPTEAIKKFDANPDWHLIVVGDLRTPVGYKLERGTYVSPAEQIQYDPYLAQAIPWNSLQRRNIGLLMAYEAGAEVVALVDDDNVPYPWWGQNLMVGKETNVNYYLTDLPAFDPMWATNYPWLWHRGFPLQLISTRDYPNIIKQRITPQVQADFWDGDPDIDAICRLEHAPETAFDPTNFPIASNAMSPFNSQNTFMLREVLKDYFLFHGIGRMDDIWASYYAQAKGHKVVYGAASVRQVRNKHDLIQDMRKEYIGYEHNLDLVQSLAKDPESIRDFVPLPAMRARELYRRHFNA